MKEIIIKQYRDRYFVQSTIGHIEIDNEFFCYTLEDTVRPRGIKVAKETAIPASDVGYNVNIITSNRFKRKVLVLSNQPDGVTIKEDNVVFTYVYSHGGNKHKDTEGCILVAYNTTGDGRIYNTAESDLFHKISEYIELGYNVKWQIFNTTQDE